MNQKQIIKLLKSGKFTIWYWDNDAPHLYEGTLNLEDFEGELGSEISPVEFDESDDGYVPALVKLLVKALGGKVESI